MKRPPVLDPPHVTRRKRALSREELELWENVAKQAKPLRKRTRFAKVSESIAQEAPVIVKPPQVLKTTPAPQKISIAPPAPPPLAPLGRRERSHLSKGRKEIDARLDLHGMTQTRAHRALMNFLHDAQANGMTFVLVITGKGRTAGPESERGILRRQVPHWLSLPEFRNFVVGFEEAHIGHGGEGALYVRVRRAR
ncbi:Smr/MutS family protein [soil metagenome]